jgi:hypothetical protein
MLEQRHFRSIPCEFSSGAFTTNVTFPVIVQPNQMGQIPITFTPADPVYYKDSVFIYHNDINFAYSKVKLNGRGIFVGPVISSSVSDINYGNKRIRSTGYREISFENLGSAELDVDSIRFDTETFYLVKPNDDFTIDSVGIVTFQSMGKSIKLRIAPGYTPCLLKCFQFNSL